jgi:hypothetical protein
VTATLDDAAAALDAAWPRALVAFSPYTRLAPPIGCRTEADEAREGLSESFAMIRMKDQRIVISLRLLVAQGLVPHVFAILAHEVGHYVHAPGTLDGHIRLHDRIRRTLTPALGAHAGLVANLYTDLSLNDRLERGRLADMAAVYEALRQPDASPLWAFYMRTYERLWTLPSGKLVARPTDEIDADAELAARVVRHFRERFLDGAASFAKLVEPYLADLPKEKRAVAPWLDTTGMPIGDRVPGGLLDDDFNPDAVLHPALDGELTDGAGDEDEADSKDGDTGDKGTTQTRGGSGRSLRGDGRPDKRRVKRGPLEWVAMLRTAGVQRTGKELVVRYYRELAAPHLIPFPAQRVPRAGDPLPEGLSEWAPGSPLQQVDWFESLVKSPVPIPGVTLVEREYGLAEGGEPERRVPDLYVGIDCSGSMGNPAAQVAYPVVAGVVLALSALRAGARVMACLSGEWHGEGQHTETAGFTRDEQAVLRVLTDYLGTGASFGLPRLVVTFAQAPPPPRPVHILIVSDSDLFDEVNGTANGWALLAASVAKAGGGATAVLRLIPHPSNDPWLARLREAGVEPHCVASEPELVTFARAFARRTFGAA